IRQSNKKLFPLQLEESGVIKDPNWDTYVESDFENIPVYEPLNTGTTYTDWKVKYAAENTSENPNRENSTYASIQVQFVPTFFCDAKGDPTIASNNLSTDFWVVKDKDGNIYYFDDNSNAIAFSTSIGSTVSAKYTGGVCYYSAYLNPDNGYNTIRNSFYILNIKSLVPPGRPTAEPDPSDPLSEPTDMKFDANIAPWGIFEKDYELL
ncbi:MAG: fimbria major subunit, partial [Odoribacteraceae bacterium]|nr:fimbria major subunit [Odoribacteraceae bacterium]